MGNRREFSKSVQRAAFVRAAGKCERCGAKLSVGKFAYDHVNPDGLTGAPTLSNCQVLCSPCHKEKTRKDVADIARAKRRADKQMSIADPHRRPISSRGFQKSQGQNTCRVPVKGDLPALPRRALFIPA